MPKHYNQSKFNKKQFSYILYLVYCATSCLIKCNLCQSRHSTTLCTTYTFHAHKKKEAKKKQPKNFAIVASKNLSTNLILD